MGIRFYCPTCGNKLNVKAFLAGKRGVCPQCGAGLDIPLESQIGQNAEKKASKPPGREKADSAVPDESMTVPVVPPSSADSTPDGLPATVPASSEPVMATAVSSSAAQADSPPTEPMAVPTGPAAEAQPATPVRPATRVATPVTPAPVDPIEESPDSSWYVRPPSGGQYGPARGDIMRKWMSEGRVSSDSLVWRDGWEDWRTACEVFPSLGSAAVPPAPVPAPAPYAPSAPAASSVSSYRPRRRNSTALAITVVVVLGLMSVALLITLVWVMRS